MTATKWAVGGLVHKRCLFYIATSSQGEAMQPDRLGGKMAASARITTLRLRLCHDRYKTDSVII